VSRLLGLLVECGEALYSAQWQSALARDLGVADRTVRRCVAGTSEAPPGLYVDLLRCGVTHNPARTPAYG
jgi:hypothetical protein